MEVCRRPWCGDPGNGTNCVLGVPVGWAVTNGSQGESMDSTDTYFASGTDEGRYRLLVNSIRDYAIYLLDPNGTVVNWNQGAQRLKGYAADEIVGQNFSLFY